MNVRKIIREILSETFESGKRIISEKLANVDDDVDMLYDTYFRDDIEELERTGIMTNLMFMPYEVGTRFLTSKESIESNELNKCIIKVNYGSSFYEPHKQIISISVDSGAVNYVKQMGDGNLESAIQSLELPREKQSMSHEFTEERIKGTIHHELAHWIDDTLHNQHLTKRIERAMELQTKDICGIPVNSTKMEIQGQIHNIKQLHNKYSNIWDELTFDEMLKYSPTLSVVNRQLTGDVHRKWKRDIIQRMSREGLLGKSMRY